MQTGKPKKTYIKTQIGKVVVHALNPFNDEPIEVILEGNPRKFEEGTMIDLWTDKQIVYFERMNERFIKSEFIQEIDRKSIDKNNVEYSSYTNKDILELYDRAFLSFKHFIDNVYDIDFLQRMLQVAHENGIEKKGFLKAVTKRIENLAAVKSNLEPGEE